MKALIYTAPETVHYGEVAAPASPPVGTVQVRVAAAGICGSDMHAFLGHDERRPPPLILGHEAAGTIVGDDRRVTINPLVTCGVCDNCQIGRDNLCAKREIISMPPRAGAFAEFVDIPLDNLITVPDDISLTQAALAEPLACGWHAVRLGGEMLAIPLPACRCLVIGGGAIGLGAALGLRAHDATHIRLAETNTRRRQTAATAGDFEVYDPLEKGAPSNDIADFVIDAVGNSATRAMACRAAKPGGVIVHIGLGEAAGGIDARRLTLQEIMFVGTYTYTKEDFRAVTAAIFAGRLGGLDWVEERPLKDGAAAFADLRGGIVAAAKIILKP